MAVFEVTTSIRASPTLCFDLSRDLDFHTRSLAHTQEEAVAGRTHGVIDLGEVVTWRGKHFGFWHNHTAKITALDRPKHFRDEMISGRFVAFSHDHFFESAEDGTLMRDVVRFRSPVYFGGALTDWAFLTGYLRRLIECRNRVLQQEAERRSPKAEPTA